MTPPYVLTKSEAERLVGHRVSSEVLAWPLIGHRILVALEPPKARYGSIIVPTQSQKYPARGWVISVGELVGQRWHPASGECTGFWPIKSTVQVGEREVQVGRTESGEPILGMEPVYETYPAPWTLLGVRVLFGAYAGEALVFEPDSDVDEGKDWVTSMREENMDSLEYWRSPYKVITDGDIWAYDGRTLKLKGSNETETRALKAETVES